MGVTYGVSGEELNKYIDNNGQKTIDKDDLKTDEGNTDNTYERTKDPYICCCYSEKDINYDDGYIKPYNNAKIEDSNKNSLPFNDDVSIEEQKDSTHVEIWNYRYSKTGYIYPNTKQIIEENNKELDTVDKTITTLVTRKRSYHPKIYYQGRDWTSSFGFNNFYYGNDMDMMDPKSQYTTAFQTLCLTGIYKRLERLKNILTSVRNCLETVKYTNKYSSDSCKELFSKYVCSFANDILVSLMSGCSPFGSMKTGTLFEEDSMPAMIGQGIGGIYEGVTESVTDLGTEYDNNQITELLTGGQGEGIAHKACMAALGYDWDLSMDSLLDAAYTESINTDVLVLAPKRERLTINPVTGKPTYEYRGAVQVMAGCDIQSYSVDLICVTQNEHDPKKGVSCTSPYTCNCMGANIVTGGNVYMGALTGGKIKSSTILDKSFSKLVNDRNYVYDHLKITLRWDKNKYKNCMPPEHADGIWYYPIKDNSPVVDAGCTLNAATGEIRCSSGLAKELGISTAYIYDMQVPDTANIGQDLTAILNIGKNGEGLMCLEFTVYKQDPVLNGESAQRIGLPKIIDLSMNTERSSGEIPYTVLERIPENILGTSVLPTIGISSEFLKDKNIAYQGGVNNPFSINYELLEAPQTTKTLTFTLQDGNDDGNFECNDKDTYIVGNNAPQQFSQECIIDLNGAKIILRSVKPTNEADRGLLHNKKIEMTFSFVGSTSNSVEAPIWITARIKIPKEGTTNCQGSYYITSTSQQPVSMTRQVLIRRQGTTDTQNTNSLTPTTSKAAGPTTQSTETKIFCSDNQGTCEPSCGSKLTLPDPTNICNGDNPRCCAKN